MRQANQVEVPMTETANTAVLLFPIAGFDLERFAELTAAEDELYADD